MLGLIRIYDGNYRLNMFSLLNTAIDSIEIVVSINSDRTSLNRVLISERINLINMVESESRTVTNIDSKLGKK